MSVIRNPKINDHNAKNKSSMMRLMRLERLGSWRSPCPLRRSSSKLCCLGGEVFKNTGAMAASRLWPTHHPLQQARGFCDPLFFFSFFFSLEKAWSIILKVFQCSDVFMIPSCILLQWQDRPRKSSQSFVWKKPKTSMLRAMQLCRNENNWWLQFWHLQRHIFDMNRILWIHFCFFGASWAWYGLTLVDVRMLFLTKFSFEARFSRFCVRLKLFLFLFFSFVIEPVWGVRNAI